ncbi:STAGA complex 65 subunit gamma-like isoform X1 [Bombus affinis]|uniref:STAGA complex 65 subunit gamma-like isoform X1 n=1 Tax=Bombus terrestris TaxID=30195 RepID=A0A9B7CWE1_BOMTE|nr:STAGA complex 65 subunit gamma-like isoform X1 [Bombus terrestris]XP_020719127.1 STAGA complex 65 subunit gamma-like isoform X1 [Bombus terrestris]XP_020719128.1 STAGA complex 65 subunit gamma-like isoform X1 [Bombus terrestris]XP_020719129.1 STAGA complex 65 subunit gamma-like isoform X1 [Bombus terrestris]XP_050575906.1 STAGA complex 65 subunit gamma-like isoform X1 [Bombus affinis]XP_050575907.1 STAGA complex 65 subunit gamma-like isoform X1 [Bombus affinis]XP_050575908.1 STAGA complex 
MKSTKNIGTGTLWGELPARETLKQEVITPDVIENIWRQVMEESNNPDCDFQVDKKAELPMGNLHVLNTINLHQQLRMMEEGMVLENMTTIEVQDLQEVQKERNVFKNASTIHYLTPETARSILKHAVITLLAHIGFEKSSNIAIETLTDIANHFLRRMTLLMKAAYEQRDHGFPDILERVLVETGIGGVAALHDYYQEYVLKFENNMKKKVEAMMEKQRQFELNVYSAKMVLDEAANKLQFEELDEFGNVYREVPTLQLLDPEMGFPPSLDAGFQMLYSLEQDELNNLEVEEEEVNVSDSPNTGQRPDISNDKKKS